MRNDANRPYGSTFRKNPAVSGADVNWASGPKLVHSAGKPSEPGSGVGVVPAAGVPVGWAAGVAVGAGVSVAGMGVDVAPATGVPTGSALAGTSDTASVNAVFCATGGRATCDHCDCDAGASKNPALN